MCRDGTGRILELKEIVGDSIFLFQGFKILGTELVDMSKNT